MVGPSFDPAPSDTKLTLLKKWTAPYTRSEAISDRIVRRTISIAATDPEVLNGSDLKQDLFALLHRVALEEIGTPPSAHP